MNFASNFALCAILIGLGASRIRRSGASASLCAASPLRQVIEVEDENSIVRRELD